jgi:hypothetical protein
MLVLYCLKRRRRKLESHEREGLACNLGKLLIMTRTLSFLTGITGQAKLLGKGPVNAALVVVIIFMSHDPFV